MIMDAPREDLEKDILDLGDFKISTHSDADGIFSAVLLAHAFRGMKAFRIADEFGDVQPDEKICLDMVPLDPKWQGICIDHHPQHANRLYSYKLKNLGVPTTLAVFTLFRHRIPETQWWKVAAGTSGDGQPELIPPEVWRKNPELLESYAKVSEYYGKTSIKYWPLWKLMSSPINNLAKTGQKVLAYNTAYAAKSPYDILNDPAGLVAHERINGEVDRIRKTTRGIDLGPVVFWEIDNPTPVGNLLAGSVFRDIGKTAVIANRNGGAINFRGVLTNLLVEELSKKGWKVGGHAGFAGGSLEGKESKSLLQAIRDIVPAYRRED